MTGRLLEQRGTSNRGTDPGTSDSSKSTTSAAARNPSKAVSAGDPTGGTVAPIGNCRDFITIDPEKSDTRTGIAVHRVIREQVGKYIGTQGYGPPVPIRLPDASFAHYRDQNTLSIGNKGSGQGDVDLAFRSRSGNVMLLCEIKPANWEALIGETQLANYIDKANANEEIKRKLALQVFSPMRPDDAMLPAEVNAVSRRFVIKWCGPGIILYKEVNKKDDREKQKQDTDKKSSNDLKQQQQASKSQGNDQASATEPAKPRSLEVLRSAPRRLDLPAWTPPALREAIQQQKLPDGLYRDRFTAAWPSGYSTNVVVWVKTTALGTEYQFYQEFPADPGFYQYLAKRKELSEWQRELVRSTLVEYNNDLWSLLSPDSRTGAPSSMSPYYARDELRRIYAEVLKGVVGGSLQIVASGSAITSVANAMRQRATGGRAIEGRSIQDEPSAGTREDPLPDWVTQAVEAGAKAFRAGQRGARAVP